MAINNVKHLKFHDKQNLLAADVAIYDGKGRNIAGKIDYLMQQILNESGLRATNINALENKIQNIEGFHLSLPIGSIYMSTVDVSPASIFGGTWEQLKDRFLLACGDTYSNGATGGESSHTLTTNEMPSHNHYSWTDDQGNHRLTLGAVATGSNFHKVLGGALGASYLDGDIVTSSTGGGASHNNMPPYLAVYMWKRTA